jgi:hypothetical protein
MENSVANEKGSIMETTQTKGIEELCYKNSGGVFFFALLVIYVSTIVVQHVLETVKRNGSEGKKDRVLTIGVVRKFLAIQS